MLLASCHAYYGEKCRKRKPKKPSCDLPGKGGDWRLKTVTGCGDNLYIFAKNIGVIKIWTNKFKNRVTIPAIKLIRGNILIHVYERIFKIAITTKDDFIWLAHELKRIKLNFLGIMGLNI